MASTFRIGYVRCSACGNEQHKKHSECRECGAGMDGDA